MLLTLTSILFRRIFNSIYRKRSPSISILDSVQRGSSRARANEVCDGTLISQVNGGERSIFNRLTSPSPLYFLMKTVPSKHLIRSAMPEIIIKFWITYKEKSSRGEEISVLIRTRSIRGAPLLTTPTPLGSPLIRMSSLRLPHST